MNFKEINYEKISTFKKKEKQEVKGVFFYISQSVVVNLLPFTWAQIKIKRKTVVVDTS